MMFAILREQLERWQQTYPPAPPIPNKNYNTLGILVPMTEFNRHCQQTINITNNNKAL